MDNKKLMQILLHDAGEMEELINDIRKSGSYDALDMELLQTRISGIRHLLETAAGMPDAGGMTNVIPGKPVTDTVIPIKEKLKQGKSFFRKDRNLQENPPSEPVVDKQVRAISEEVAPTTVLQDIHPEKETAPAGTAMELEEESIHPGDKQILAEKFVAGKSLNDLLLEKSRTDLKFSGMPLSSLTGAIGTNERFLFSRELFDGNMESFNETIQKIDALNNIREAADFLRDNFKWKKSETSLRFIDLVKRRFAR